MRKIILSVVLAIVLSSCVNQEKAKPRAPQEQMYIGDPAQTQKDELEKINRSRELGEMGLGMASEPCRKFTLNPLEIAAQELSGCKETYFLRLKFSCKFDMGMPEPYLMPLRHKEIELEIVSSSEALNQLFPKKLFTESNGVVETSFRLRGLLPNDIKFAVKRNGQRHEITESRASITLPESLCADKKQQ